MNHFYCQSFDSPSVKNYSISLYAPTQTISLYIFGQTEGSNFILSFSCPTISFASTSVKLVLATLIGSLSYFNQFLSQLKYHSSQAHCINFPTTSSLQNAIIYNFNSQNRQFRFIFEFKNLRINMILSRIRNHLHPKNSRMFSSQVKGSSNKNPIPNIDLMIPYNNNKDTLFRFSFSNYISFKHKNAFGTMKFFLPDLGEKIKQGTVKTLYIKEGQKVQQFQKLSDVQSDKQFTQITSPATGVIKKIHYKQSQICRVGDLFLELEVEGQIPFQNQPTSQTNKVEDATLQVKVQNKSNSSTVILNHQYGDQILTSPTVIMIAKQNKIDLRDVKGSGKRGRITKQDIILYMQNPNKYQAFKSKASQIVSKKSGLSENEKTYSEKKDRKISSSGYGQQTIVSMKPAQVYNCKLMNESATIPHLFLQQEFDITESQKMRNAIKAYYQKSGVKISLTSIILKTLSMTLRKYPKMNSLYDPKSAQFQFHIQSEHNISIALDTVRHGLLYPTLHNVNSMNVLEISQQISRIKQLAESQSLETLQQNGYLNQGSICVSNIGTIGGISANSKLVPPQVCVINIGKAITQVKMSTSHNGQTNYSKKKVVHATLGCDHRVLDGATVARFCTQWKKYIQNPHLLMQQLI